MVALSKQQLIERILTELKLEQLWDCGLNAEEIADAIATAWLEDRNRLIDSRDEWRELATKQEPKV